MSLCRYTVHILYISMRNKARNVEYISELESRALLNFPQVPFLV